MTEAPRRCEAWALALTVVLSFEPGAAAQTDEFVGRGSALASEVERLLAAEPQPLQLPPGFGGLAGRIQVRARTGFGPSAYGTVSLLQRTPAGATESLAVAETDAAGDFFLEPLEAPSGSGAAVYLEAVTDRGTLRAPVLGTVSEISPATDAAWRIAQTHFPDATDGQMALIVALAQVAQSASSSDLSDADTSLEIERRLEGAIPGLEVFVSATPPSAKLQQMRDYVDVLEELRQDVRDYCAHGGFGVAEAEALLSRVEARVPTLMAFDLLLEAEDSAAALQMSLQKSGFDVELVRLLLMVSDLAYDNLNPGFPRATAVGKARSFCAYLGSLALNQLTWVPQLSTQFQLEIGVIVPLPEIIDIDHPPCCPPPPPPDPTHPGPVRPTGVDLEFIFLHPAFDEPERLMAHANAACGWQELSKWKCEVLEMQGKQFYCDRPNNDCCSTCDCVEPLCGYQINCETCMDAVPGTHICYSRTELETGAYFTVPMSYGLVGLLVRIADSRQLVDDQKQVVAVLDLLYDGVPIASTRQPGGSGPRWVGPPFDHPYIFQWFDDATFAKALSTLGHRFDAQVVDKVALLVGKPSEVEAGEHRSLFLEARGDLFNGALIVWQLAIPDSLFSITGVRNPTDPACSLLSPPVSQVPQLHYFESMTADIRQLAMNGYPGVLKPHTLRAVLSLPDGTVKAHEVVLPAPVDALSCPACADQPYGSQVVWPQDQTGPCRTKIGEDLKYFVEHHIWRIGAKVLADAKAVATNLALSRAEGKLLDALPLPDWGKMIEGNKTLPKIFKKWPGLQRYAERTMNFFHRTLGDPGDAARQFYWNWLKNEITGRLAAGESPIGSLVTSTPAAVQASSRVLDWNLRVDHCVAVLCPDAYRALRYIRQDIKDLTGGTLATLNGEKRFQELLTETGDGIANTLFRSLRFEVAEAQAASAVAIGRYIDIANWSRLVMQVGTAVSASAQIALHYSRAEEILREPDSFRGPHGACP